MTTNRRVLFSATLSLVVAAGCGELGGNDAGTSCSTDANCSTGKVCHPVLKACVDSCTGGDTCPAEAKTCAKADGSAATSSSPGFCQCSTDALCNNKVAGNICSAATKQCSAKCTSNSNCPSGYTCNSTSGQCTGGSTGDAGSDAGMMMDAGTTCNMANAQPDVCAHGWLCTTGSVCGAAVDGTCGNIANAKNPAAPTMARPAFVAGTSTGPVIFNIVDEATDDDAFCASGQTAFTVTLHAYQAAGSLFPATKSGLMGLWYFDSSGTPVDAVASARPSGYTQLDNGKGMTLKVTLCPAAGTSLQAGFAFTNGNGYCINISR